MAHSLVHWRYLQDEALHRWRRTLLTIGGIALAIALVVLLDLLLGLGRDVGTTLLMVTHDRDIAARADVIIEIKDGRIEA